MIAMPCRPRSPLTSMASPGWTFCGAILQCVLDDADAGGVDEQAVAFAFVHDLGVAGDDLHAGTFCAASRMEETTRQRVSIGRPSSMMKAALR